MATCVSSWQDGQKGAAVGRYETSLRLIEAGVLNGRDMTVEAVVAKLMFLLGRETDLEVVKAKMNTSLAGEVTLLTT